MMNRRSVISWLATGPIVGALTARTAATEPTVQPAKVCGDDADTIMMAFTVLFTREEVLRERGRGTLGELLRAKAENMSRSFIENTVQEIERRGWCVVEYAKNTTQR